MSVPGRRQVNSKSIDNSIYLRLVLQNLLATISDHIPKILALLQWTTPNCTPQTRLYPPPLELSLVSGICTPPPHRFSLYPPCCRRRSLSWCVGYARRPDNRVDGSLPGEVYHIMPGRTRLQGSSPARKEVPHGPALVTMRGGPRRKHGYWLHPSTERGGHPTGELNKLLQLIIIKHLLSSSTPTIHLRFLLLVTGCAR